jgi:hypothetical protein
MFKHKLLAALPLVFCSLSASAGPGDIDNLFNEWDTSWHQYGIFTDVPPVLDKTQAVFGGSFYIVDPTQPVEFTFVTSEAGFDLKLSVASWDSNGNIGPWEQVFDKQGSSVFKPATQYYIEPTFFSYAGPTGASEIFLKLEAYNPTTKETYIYYSGPGANNFDGDVHAVAFYNYYNGQTLVGFEDMNRSINADWDYDDIVFLVSNVQGVVPEPETWAMLLAGLGMVGAMARRKKAAK